MRYLPLGLVSLLLSVPAALSCECSYAPACQRINHAAAIFIGTVVENGPAGQGPFRFAVEEAFKGIDRNIREIEVQAAPCISAYRTGERYLVMAGQWNERALFSSDCTGTVPANVALEDIKLIRAWAHGEPSMQLQGRTAENIEDSMIRFELDVEHKNALAGVEIVATRDGKSFKALSDSNGFFHVPVPGPGDYRVTATYPGHASSSQQYRFSVEAGSCFEHDIGMWTDSRIRGHIFDPRGKPVAAIPVEMDIVSGDIELPLPLTAPTDRTGEFFFTKVPPGEYIIGVNVNGLSSIVPYAPRFYPGVDQKEKAVPVHVEGAGLVKDLDFRIGNPLPTRSIEVKLIWPDGRPVSNGSVTCMSPRSNDQRRIDRVSRYVDSDGGAFCQVLADRDFNVEADRLSWTNSSRPVQPVATRPKIFVPAGTSTVSVQIIVDSVNDISDKETPVNMSHFNDREIGR